MVAPFDPAKLTLSEITKVQERVTAIFGAPTTLDQAVMFIQNNMDLVPAILGTSKSEEVTTAAPVVAPVVVESAPVKAPKVPTKVDIYPVVSKSGKQYRWDHLPWSDWTNGEVWELRLSNQMNHRSIHLFRHIAAGIANRKGMTFSSTMKSRHSQFILIQFTPKVDK